MMKVVVLLTYSVLLAFQAKAQNNDKTCDEMLQKIEPCLAFLQGSVIEPPQECCSNIKQIRATNPLCLCILIKESTNPSLKLSLNQTRLIQMPDTCEIQGKLSDCIAVLHLSPNSSDARIFEAGNNSAPPEGSGSGDGSIPETNHLNSSSSEAVANIIRVFWAVTLILLVIPA